MPDRARRARQAFAMQRRAARGDLELAVSVGDGLTSVDSTAVGAAIQPCGGAAAVSCTDVTGDCSSYMARLPLSEHMESTSTRPGADDGFARRGEGATPFSWFLAMNAEGMRETTVL